MRSTVQWNVGNAFQSVKNADCKMQKGVNSFYSHARFWYVVTEAYGNPFLPRVQVGLLPLSQYCLLGGEQIRTTDDDVISVNSSRTYCYEEFLHWHFSLVMSVFV